MLISTNAFTQRYYLDTLPKFDYQNSICFQGRLAQSGFGLIYRRYFCNGIGFRNYQGVGLGLFHVNSPDSKGYRKAGIDLQLQHNHRPSLKRLLFFTFQLGYKPMIPLEKPGNEKLYDDYINSGYCMLGITGYVKHLRIACYLGAEVSEAKQDLYYSVHTYAHFYPELMLNIGFSFGKK